MNCEEFKKHLPDLVDGGLSEPVSRQMLAHKDSCPACGKMFADHSDIIRGVAHSAVSIPIRLHENILARLQLNPSDTPSAPRGPSSPADTAPTVLGTKAILKLAGILAAGLGILAVPALFHTSSPKSAPLVTTQTSHQTASFIPPTQLKTEPETESSAPTNERAIRVAAADSSPADKKAARYLCSGRNDENQIMAAFNMLGGKPGTVELSEGTYGCSGILTPPAGITVSGRGSGKTLLAFEGQHSISISINQPGITLKDFSVTGRGSILVRCGKTRIQGVTAQKLSASVASPEIPPEAAFDLVASDKPLSDVAFENCTVLESDLAGFALRSLTTASKLSGIRLTGCQTIACGLTTNRPGYLVSQAQDVTFRDCTDERSHIGWIIADQSGKINIIDSSAKANASWALWVHDAHHLSIMGFRQIDHACTEGTQSLNGVIGTSGTVTAPVSDSIFELFGQGSSKLPLINEVGLRNQFSLHPGTSK